MSTSIRKPAAAMAQTEEPAAAAGIVKKQKMPALLVTTDDTLWPQIGADLGKDLALKQLDSIDELIGTSPSGQSAVLLWDARGQAEPVAVLSRLNMHSARYAVVVFDTPAGAGVWAAPLQHRQVVAHVAMPLAGDALKRALDAAAEEVNARSALLGDGLTPPPAELPVPPRKQPWVAIGAGLGVALVCLAVFVLTRHAAQKPSPGATAPGAVTPAASHPTAGTPAAAATPAAGSPAAGSPAAGEARADNQEKIDLLIEKAQQAMNDRHYVDPAAGSALNLYREVLLLDPDNGEATQGLQRLGEMLIARVQSALDDKKFDVALQLLETARSIDPGDPRVAALDEKIAALRAELGPAQIAAAINAQNFDRAAQLIDDAVRAKTLAPAKAALLRDDLHRRRDESETARLLKLIDVRLQQDRLVDPRNDSAAFYIEQARQAGAPAATLQPTVQDLTRRLTADAHAAVDQHRFADADRFINELRGFGVPGSVVSGLTHDLAAARTLAAQPKAEQPQFLDLAQARLAQGRLLEPENDSALYYIGQARTQDPRNPDVSLVAAALQAQLISNARAALDSGDAERAAALLQKGATLGPSAELDGLTARLRVKAQTAAAGTAPLPTVPEQSLTRARKLDVQYPLRAQETGTEGWVDVGFMVNADGSVANVKVINASPSAVFDTAASKAVKALRYQPVLQAGVPTAVNTQIKVVFRLPK